ncbi:MAG: hypothetical protein JO273_05380 [Methylobacteriaceae bacterium]|nr:hypothetical protein [Methylobacteriaceae bacterium]
MASVTAPASLISVEAKHLGTPAFDRILPGDAQRVEQEGFVSRAEVRAKEPSDHRNAASVRDSPGR